MAQTTADYLVRRGIHAGSLTVSPLERTQESAAPIARAFGLTPRIDERLVEAGNKFEGRPKAVKAKAFLHPKDWPLIVNPLKPSWGEPYADIAERMLAAMADACDSTEEGDAIIVTHQLPIWAVHLATTGERLYHDPRKRRCALSSVTTFERNAKGEGFHEIGYADPNAQTDKVDEGAV